MLGFSLTGHPKKNVLFATARLFLFFVLCFSALAAQANILSVAVTGGGRVEGGENFCTAAGETSCSASYGAADATVTLIATADTGMVFNGWGGECATAGSSLTCTIVVIGFADDVDVPVQNVSASFSVPTFTLSVVVSGAGSVSSAASQPGINCPGDCSEAYTAGSSVLLTATANSAVGSVFTGWLGGGCSGTGTCLVTMTSAQTVTAVFETDSDGDGVFDPSDLCPATPPETSVDAAGCASSQLDTDEDGIANSLDQCPDTPPGVLVDETGCSLMEPDSDGDGVSDDLDQCPNTPPGEPVDEAGCSPSQLDSDEDDVLDAVDQCPDTPPGEAVDANGCSLSQLDSDADGVADDADQCPETPPDTTVDAAGCANSQLDTDEDGIANSLDQCPDTPPNTEVDGQGCSIIQRFGNDLGNLPGLSSNEQLLGARIDEICPGLILSGATENLTPGQQDLRDACRKLKDRGTSENQAVTALREISLRELASQKDYAIEMATTQYRHLGSRLDRVNAGGGRGLSLSGLNINTGEQAIPGYVLQSVFDGLLGMGASGDSANDFGKLGLFIQGDLDFGERDESALESGYDIDAWNLAIGADYRFTDTLFTGLSLGLGEAEIDYDGNGGSSDISSWTLSAYGGWQLSEHWYLDGLLSYGNSEFETTRKLSYGDSGGLFTSSQRGDTDGEQIFIGLNTGYMVNDGAWRFGPTASLTYLDGSIDAFTETAKGASSAAWNFAVDKQDYRSLRLSLGAQVDYAFSTSFGVIIPAIRASYIAEREDGPEQIALRLVNNPFAEDTLSSEQIMVTTDGRDNSFLDISFNLSGQFIMGFSGFMSYQFYSSYDDYSQEGFTLGLRWDKPY